MSSTLILHRGARRVTPEELVEIPAPIVKRVDSQLKAVTVGQGAGLTWPGLLRKLDRIDPSYRE